MLVGGRVGAIKIFFSCICGGQACLDILQYFHWTFAGKVNHIEICVQQKETKEGGN